MTEPTSSSPAPGSCAYHAAIMAALIPADSMGPRTRAVYDRFALAGDQRCIAHESQVVLMFRAAVAEDMAAGWTFTPPAS